MNIIRSHRHEVYTEEVNKIALCPGDDKRYMYILDDGVHTLALGHYFYKAFDNGVFIKKLYYSFNRIVSFTNWTNI